MMKKTTKIVSIVLSTMAFTALMSCTSNNKKNLTKMAADVITISTDYKTKSDALNKTYENKISWTADAEEELDRKQNSLTAIKKLATIKANMDIAEAEILLEAAQAGLKAATVAKKEGKDADQIREAAYKASNDTEDSYDAQMEALEEALYNAPSFNTWTYSDKKSIDLKAKNDKIELDYEKAEEKLLQKWDEKTWKIAEKDIDPLFEYQQSVEGAKLNLSFVTKTAKIDAKAAVFNAKKQVKDAKEALSDAKKAEKRAAEAVKILAAAEDNPEMVSSTVLRMANAQKNLEERLKNNN